MTGHTTVVEFLAIRSKSGSSQPNKEPVREEKNYSNLNEYNISDAI